MLKASLFAFFFTATLMGYAARAESEPVSEAQIRAREVAIASGQSAAQAQEAFEAAGFKIKKVIKTEGRPYRMVFENGYQIGFKLKMAFVPLRSSMILSDNSCTHAIGNRGEIVIPTVHRSLIAYWAKHPTKKDEPVIKKHYDDITEVVFSETAVISRMLNPLYDQLMDEVPVGAIKDEATFAQSKANGETFGWMNCEGTCDGLLPATKQALFWDENFEIQNNQTRMARNSKHPSFNQMTSRLQLVPLKADGRAIIFGQPARTFGPISRFLPPGITYQMQWTFREKNLVITDDDLCQMKWDLDFTRLFTTFIQASESVRDPKKVDAKAYPDYNFTESDVSNEALNSMFSTQSFESSGMQR